MRLKPIMLHCDCHGRFPARIKQVGLTPGRQLVIQWRCGSCKRTHFTTRSLADYWRECPDIGESIQEPAESKIDLLHDDDLRFLHSLGVAMPEEEQV
jgi:hypothetical protein